MKLANPNIVIKFKSQFQTASV